ncbi:MAG: hypothetical protein IPJ32_18340 [Sphingobacteriaceae bacterium]|nr:hypothetical protein [Sphingobacteriaceae bacterium]
MGGNEITNKKEITSALLIAAMFFILAMAMKNYGHFFITTLTTVVKHYTLWLEKRNQKARANTNRLKWISICFPILISWLCFTDGFSVLRKSPYRFGVSIDEQSLPVEATAFLNNNNIYGKLLNHLDFGGYMMNNYPEKVFIDGRLELPSQEFFKKYFNSLSPGGLENLLMEYKPDIIIFSVQQSNRLVVVSNWR